MNKSVHSSFVIHTSKSMLCRPSSCALLVVLINTPLAITASSGRRTSISTALFLPPSSPRRHHHILRRPLLPLAPPPSFVGRSSAPSDGTTTIIMSSSNTNTNGDEAATTTATPKKTGLLARITPSEVKLEIKNPVDPTALEQSRAILNEIRPNPKEPCDPTAILTVAKRLGDLPDDDDQTSFVIPLEECQKAYEALPPSDRQALDNIHTRVKLFALAQRKSITDITVGIPGGKAGHTVSPTSAAGCYAPGGRYPLPSSVIMTVVTAKAAGCPTVVLASPKPAQITKAAAYVSGATMVLGLGGAQAIGAMAYGTTPSSTSTPAVPNCDVIVGPGNKWVTAAKSLVNGQVGIDMLAGPSEVLVIADDTASPQIVASDLIAQAEHDIVARAILLSTCEKLIDLVEKEVEKQLEVLPEPNRSTAREAFTHSFAVHCTSLEQCIELSDSIAPEHLEIQTRDASDIGKRCAHYGGLFLGSHAAEVLGDYGAGPNHTLPTGGTGRYTGGLSVFDFLRIRTWMEIDNVEDSQTMVEDSIIMARLEGLEGHARAAELRRVDGSSAGAGDGEKKGEEDKAEGEPPAAKKAKMEENVEEKKD